MKIKVWGVRGSIPVSGVEFNKYGGDTTCIEIRSKDNELIIVDAGTGIRRLGNKILKEDDTTKLTMLFTHSHWDHLMGLPYFKPIYFPKYSIRMYGCPFAEDSIKKVISKTMSPPYFPVEFSALNSRIDFRHFENKKWTIGSIEITPIYISHPNKGVGYKFMENDKTFVFLTDNELTYLHEGGLELKDYLAFSQNADILFHDSEYTPKDYMQTWGHSKYTDSLQLAIEAKVRRFGMIHHNQDRTDEEIDAIVEKAKTTIIKKNSNLDCFAVYAGQEINL